MKKILLLLGVAFIAAGFFLAWFVPRAWFRSPTSEAQNVTVTIGDGWNVRQVADTLVSNGIIDSAWGYRLYARLDATAMDPKAGTYPLKPSQSYAAVAHALALGPPSNEVKITIPEGWSLADIGKAVSPYGVEHFPVTIPEELRTEYSFLADLPSDASLEGYLFPDTYRVYADQLPQSLIKKQLDEFAKRAPGLEEESQKQGRTLNDVVILASIIEKEVSSSDDRKIVAGIFLNRIKDGMPLQSDATVNYITHGGRARPTADDLTSDSPYNTYKVKGLPPGPISNPGDDALMAALHPTQTDYRYFLTDAAGKTYFAKTFAEHQANRVKAFGN